MHDRSPLRAACASPLAALLAALLAAPDGVAQTPPKKPAAAAAVPAGGYSAEARKWAHESSDLAPDPRFHFGKLKNGLRWAWAASTNPPKTVHLRLHLDVGSLVEKGDELGVAHFLEHMAFNGSRSFKAGTLVPFFQTQGIRFGSDVNAHTGFDETVYELDLPDAEGKRLEKAFTWFRDIVDGLKLEPKEIDAEKGVVDAEESVRGGAGFKAMVDLFGLVLDGTRYPRRMPIGEKPVRDKFDKKLVTAFYDRWYRPENATFVVVGDLGGSDPAALIEKAFADAKGRGAPEEVPDRGFADLSMKRLLFSDHRGGGGVNLYFGMARPRVVANDDAKARAAQLALDVACDLLEARLDALEPRAFILAGVGGGDAFPPAREMMPVRAYEGVGVRLATTVEEWQTALYQADHEIRRVLERGFTDDEWKEARARLDERLKPPADAKPETSEQLLAALIAACDEPVVPMERKAALEVERKAAATLDKEACQRAFKQEWEKGKLLLASVGGLDLRDDARETFGDALQRSRDAKLDAKPIVHADLSTFAPKKEKKAAEPAAADGAPKPAEPAAKKEPAKFLHALPDAAAAPADAADFAAFAAQRVAWRNGARALLKKQDGEPGQFLLEVRFGEGMVALDPAQVDVARAAAGLLLGGGTAKQPKAELDAALAEAGATLAFDVQPDCCEFTARSTGAGGPAALRRALETICAWMNEPALAPAALDEWKKGPGRQIPDTESPTFHAARAVFEQELANGDRRRLPLDPRAAAAVTLDQAKSFLQGQLDGPIEVSLLADFALDEQRRQLDATIAQQKPRRAAAAIPESRRSALAPKTGYLEPRGAIDLAGGVAIVHIAYPCGDAVDAAGERRLDLLGDIVSDRLRADIREKLGTTYSPRGDAWGDTALKGRGFVELDLQVEPAKEKETIEACLVSMENLAKSGTTKDEFDRLRKARIGNPDELARDWGFWLRQFRRAHKAPALLEELKDLRKWYDGVTAADVNAIAKTALARSKASILTVRPR